ncbi:hypothetical protein DPX16_5554 [Anabarilius grahami]|uniref:Uncharacterized protein n=1 Tax=Anabarilius grahami TaxID=495550 RepID=A0A3N0YAN9_ANAGA|nr:hypothetical protein DPX16_5554 [Anabarilius grahami]
MKNHQTLPSICHLLILTYKTRSTEDRTNTESSSSIIQPPAVPKDTISAVDHLCRPRQNGHPLERYVEEFSELSCQHVTKGTEPSAIMTPTLVPLGLLVETEGMSWNPESAPVPAPALESAPVPAPALESAHESSVRSLTLMSLDCNRS